MHTVCFEKNIPKLLLVKVLQSLWPGVIYSALSPTRFREFPDAPLPGPRWVRVRNLLCGICASDLHLLQADADPAIAAAALPGTNWIYLGHEVVGLVSEIGAGVATLQVGDRVIMDSRVVMSATCLSQEIDPPCRHCCAGNFQLCENGSLVQGPVGVGGGWGDSFTAHMTELYRVPPEFDDETAAMIEPLSVGVRAALSRLPEPGEQVLVIGSGVVGLNVVQAVRALSPDCRITAMARYPQQVVMARQFGADEVLDQEDPYIATARITHGKLYSGIFNNRTIGGGFDVVFDCVGSARTVHDALRWTRAAGTVVLVGVNLKPLQVDLTPVWQQEVQLIGMVAHGMETWKGARIATYDLTCDLLRQGKLKTSGLITHSFRLEQWREAIKTAQDKRTGAIKVMLDYRETATTA